MLTARGDDADRIVGLELGADDYVPKPFNPRELLARVRAVLRRARPAAPTRLAAGRRIVVGPIEIDVAARTVKRDGEEVSLTSFEYRILVVLARRAGETVTREELATGSASRQGQGQARYDPSVDRSLDVHVSRLRQKLEDDPKEPRLIKTVRGVGYVLVEAGVRARRWPARWRPRSAVAACAGFRRAALLVSRRDRPRHRRERRHDDADERATSETPTRVVSRHVQQRARADLGRSRRDRRVHRRAARDDRPRHARAARSERSSRAAVRAADGMVFEDGVAYVPVDEARRGRRRRSSFARDAPPPQRGASSSRSSRRSSCSAPSRGASRCASRVRSSTWPRRRSASAPAISGAHRRRDAPAPLGRRGGARRRPRVRRHGRADRARRRSSSASSSPRSATSSARRSAARASRSRSRATQRRRPPARRARRRRAAARRGRRDPRRSPRLGARGPRRFASRSGRRSCRGSRADRGGDDRALGSSSRRAGRRGRARRRSMRRSSVARSTTSSRMRGRTVIRRTSRSR